MSTNDHKHIALWKRKLQEIIFEADTFAGKAFDIGLWVAILVSVVVVMIDSVDSISGNPRYAFWLDGIEWFVTFLFTIEYVARIIVLGKPIKYVLSFFGIIDLLSILPSYIGLFITGTEYLMVIRTLRLLRIFRVLKLARYLSEAQVLIKALRASRAKILVFVGFILVAVCILGTVIYIIEAPYNEAFTSVPRSIYWAIVTLTTVGYGDLAPSTPLGQAVAAVIMILGYGVIAVPTGIVGIEMTRETKEEDISTQSCPSCAANGHDPDAIHCKYCGAELNPET